MKKLVVLGMGVCIVLAFASCKSSESAYKKAYEKAKQQELAEPQVEAPVEVTPVVTAPVTTTKTTDTSGVRQEKVTVISGNQGLKDFSVIVGSFSVKANAEGLRDWLDAQGIKLQLYSMLKKLCIVSLQAHSLINLLLLRHVMLSKLNIRAVLRTLGCYIVLINFFLVIYIGRNVYCFPNKKAVTGKLLLFY